ncbi:hypothetical protein [Nitrosopumilus oxyclinae]|uniref:hypothetical protein n=1 Tax=Nitrosopumilus oxyclinae TaxID=1959104 RepID=UPI001FE35AE0|nr:hypothetical protein [Nitrosopumilus oxyclinae]
MAIVFSFDQVYAIPDPILITQSSGLHNVVFDGKWTHETEWKQSSHNLLSYDDDMVIHLRTAHQENFIYVFVDPIGDLTLDKNLDKATICFDAKNNKSQNPDSDDYCFSVSLNQEHGILTQGTSNGNYEMINGPEFIATSNISDENDRYTKILHPSFEFRIPIELLNRSDNYGFYLSVYDASSDKFYSWPENVTRESSQIPSPSEWGDIVSPDKSLPEMHLPFLIFTILIFAIILVQSKQKIRLFNSF